MTTVQVDASGFGRRISEYAAATGKSILDAFKVQGILLARELRDRTPPFSGKTIIRMLSAQGKKPSTTSDSGDVSGLTALKVGKRRVEKDIRRVIYGVRGAQLTRDSKTWNLDDWGVRQRCEDKPARRIFASKDGTVYGVDEANFVKDADMDRLAEHHQKARTRRGRVTVAGSRDSTIGRWKWLNILVTKESAVRKYIRDKQWMVGQAKGGWMAGAYACGAKVTGGWIGKHARAAGRAESDFSNPYKPWVRFINRSRWATAGDPDRIIAASMAGREKAMAGDIARIIKEKWGK